jgi:hypothetical protein
MSPEVIWLQIGCIAILYAQSVKLEPAMNSFLRMFVSVPLGVLAGIGFWYTWMTFQDPISLATLSTVQSVFYSLTQLTALFVVGSLIFLVYKLIVK